MSVSALVRNNKRVHIQLTTITQHLKWSKSIQSHFHFVAIYVCTFIQWRNAYEQKHIARLMKSIDTLQSKQSASIYRFIISRIFSSHQVLLASFVIYRYQMTIEWNIEPNIHGSDVPVELTMKNLNLEPNHEPNIFVFFRNID